MPSDSESFFSGTEAELIIFGKLRLGLHPQQLERELNKSLQELHDDNDDYRILFRSTCQRILNNLEFKGLFKKLPVLAVYDELASVPLRKARFEIMMYNRFEDEEKLKKDGKDDETELDMADDEALDSACLEILKAMYEKVRKDVEVNYSANRKYLEENLDNSFVITNAENPFIYDSFQKQWEGQGNRPGQYSLLTRSYAPPTRKLVQQARVAPQEQVDPSSASTILFSKDSAATENVLSTLKSAGGTQTPADMKVVLPRTPKNKLDHPIIRTEYLGQAFFARPVTRGSPEMPKRRRLEGTAVVGNSKNIDAKASGLDLGMLIDVPKQPPVKKLVSARNLDDDCTERVCRTLEDCMIWATDILQKYSVPESEISDELCNMSKTMDDHDEW